METRFRHDFRDVRIHENEQAARSAQGLNASAYTVGHDIVFAHRLSALGADAGRRLLAHELAHVIQQTSSRSRTLASPGSAEQEAHNAESALPGGFISVAEFSGPMLAKAPAQDPPPRPRLRHDGLTGPEKALLNQIRSQLIGDDEKATAIVGLLITDDGRQFPLKSGGGQGFSSHLEGKATDKMNELGVTSATLLQELEPCQICDRSVYEAAHGPETPLRSTRTGKPISRQTPKINTALPVGSRLTVVDPDSASTYWGSSTSIKLPTPGPAPKAGGSASVGTTSESEPSAASPIAAPASKGPGAGIGASEHPPPEKAAVSGPGSLRAPSTAGEAGGMEAPPLKATPIEVPEISGGKASAAGTGIAAFQIALLLMQLIPDPGEQQATQQKLAGALNDPQVRAQFRKLDPLVRQSSAVVYYTVKFKVIYRASQGWHWRANVFYDVRDVVDVEIGLSGTKIETSGKLDPPGRPAGLQMAPNMGGYSWEASRVFTISILPVRPEIGPTYGMRGDTEIREAIKKADEETIARIPAEERARIINRLFEGWVSDEDIETIRRIYQATPPAQKADVRQIIERQIPNLTSIGQRRRVRLMLAGG